MMGSFREGVKKKEEYFTVRLTISIFPTPPYDQLFVNFFGVFFFILDCDPRCSATDFTQGKSHFHPTSSIPNSYLLFAAALSQNYRIAV